MIMDIIHIQDKLFFTNQYLLKYSKTKEDSIPFNIVLERILEIIKVIKIPSNITNKTAMVEIMEPVKP